MSRGFDGFDIDDFRDPQWESERYGPGCESSQGRGSGSQSGGTVRSKLEKLREAESIGDQVAAQSREHPVAGGSPLPRETKQAALLAERERTNYRERDRGYSLRQSEIHTLTEVAKFRVVAVEDLAKFAYSGDRSRMGSDLRSLLHQGLVERRETSVLKKESRQVLTLTKQGERLVRRRFLPEDQAIYSGLVKPKEASHDADLYRLYHKVADRIEDRGGKIVRVQLDYELKEELYRKLGVLRRRRKTRPSTSSTPSRNSCASLWSMARSACRICVSSTRTRKWKSLAWTWNWQRTTTMLGILPKKRVPASRSMLGPKMSLAFAAFETTGKS